MKHRQRLYGGVRLLGDGPCADNISRVDHGAMPMIHHMMTTGMCVDLNHFAKMEKVLSEDLDSITSQVHSMTGHWVNVDSPDQVSELLFKKMGLKQARPKFTPKGDRESVEDEVLTAIQHEHPVVPLIQKYKEYSKLRGTYVVPMPKLAKHTKFGEWVMYPNLGHTRVPSGRLNCREPNLLAMPTRSKRGREIRMGFLPRAGKVMVSVDESQIEPRMAGYCSQDPGLITVYREEQDIYSDYATSAFKLSDKRYRATGEEAAKLLAKRKPAWVYPTVDAMAHRRPSKTCVLAAIYDVTAGGLLEQMPIVCLRCGKEALEESGKHYCDKFESLWTEDGCQDLLNSFYFKYPGILEDRRKNHKAARKYGYIWDIWGRILHLGAVRSTHEWVVQAALREGANFPYQSGAQGTIKLVMAKTYDEMEEWGMFGDIADPLLQIHDELLFEVERSYAQEFAMYVVNNFETCVELENMPIKAGWAMADSWGLIDK